MDKKKREPGEIFCRMRDGQVAYFVQMPHGEAFNIWDLDPSEATPRVDKAITHAFARGVELANQTVKSALYAVRFCKDVDRSAIPQED
jgi:hypothetical protein